MAAKESCGLTDDELRIVDSLGDTYNAFCKLPVYHPNDRMEFSIWIHVLQEKVMKRTAIREHPVKFTGGDAAIKDRNSAGLI